jgi:hypothetical protein
MPPARFCFELDPEARLVRIAGEGDPQAPEWIALFDQILALPGFQPGTDFLIDRRGMTSIPTSQTVEAMMDYYVSRSEQLGHCRIVSVTTNSAVYGMTRMAEVFAERTTVTVRVFRDMESAYQWLRPDEHPPITDDRDQLEQDSPA